MLHTVYQVIGACVPSVRGGLCLAADLEATEREVVILMLGLAAILMALHYRRALAAVPGMRWWAAALIARLMSWSFSILEGFVWPEYCDPLEQLLLTASTLLIAMGSWRMYRSPRRERAA